MFLIGKCATGGYGEIILSETNEPVDIQPWSLVVYDKNKKFRTASFNDCVIKYVEMLGTYTDHDMNLDRELEKLKRKLEQQRSAITSLDAEIETDKMIAESLYTIMEKIDRLILLLKTARDRKDIERTAAMLVRTGQVIDVDMETLSFSTVIDIGEKRVSVIIEVKKNFHENVSSYFDKVKKGRERLAGAKDAFQHTLKEIEAVSTRGLGQKPSQRLRKLDHFAWFEAYRWFISSDGNIVIGGKDASSNDRVVKRYLREGDRYVHAEIHGAPSVVVKRSENSQEIGEATLIEACNFALAFSKAWKQRIVHGSAYWVLPEQVSKTPNTGEFVPRGGFIIRGKKNYIQSTITCAVGIIEYQSSMKIMCGPVDAVKKHASKYIVLEPGQVSRNEMAAEIAVLLGTDVEQIQRVLPAGDMKRLNDVGI